MSESSGTESGKIGGIPHMSESSSGQELHEPSVQMQVAQNHMMNEQNMLDYQMENNEGDIGGSEAQNVIGNNSGGQN